MEDKEKTEEQGAEYEMVLVQDTGSCDHAGTFMVSPDVYVCPKCGAGYWKPTEQASSGER